MGYKERDRIQEPRKLCHFGQDSDALTRTSEDSREKQDDADHDVHFGAVDGGGQRGNDLLKGIAIEGSLMSKAVSLT